MNLNCNYTLTLLNKIYFIPFVAFQRTLFVLPDRRPV